MLDLEPIKAREQAATKGPWILLYSYCQCDNCKNWTIGEIKTVKGNHSIVSLPNFLSEDKYFCWKTYGLTEANGEFLAHARQDVPVLIAEVESLRRRVAELEGALEYYTEDNWVEINTSLPFNRPAWLTDLGSEWAPAEAALKPKEDAQP